MMNDKLRTILRMMRNDKSAVIVDRVAPPAIYAHSLEDASFHGLSHIERHELEFLIRENFIKLMPGEQYCSFYITTDRV